MANPLNNSPQVVVDIVDNTTAQANLNGVNVFVTGFAPQGPTDQPYQVSDINDFTSTFGTPTNAAERYAYDAVNQLTNANANVLFNAMPYGSGSGLGFSSLYSALVYPLIGVSATPVDPCSFYRKVDYNTCQVSFPWLLEYFTPTGICYGSQNMYCPLQDQNEIPGYLYIQDAPFEYNSIMTGFNFVVNHSNVQSDLTIFQLRPTSNGFNTTFSVVTSLKLSQVYSNADQNQVNLDNTGNILLVNLQNTTFAKTLTLTQGPLSGQVLSGLFVSAGDVFATYSSAGAPVLSYFNSNVGVSYQTSITNVAPVTAGYTFNVVTTALGAANLDMQIQFCGIPVNNGLSCATITSLGLTVPEQSAYTFQPLLGDATLNDANFYVLGEPISQTLNAGEYQLLVNQQFNWQCGAVANNIANLDVVNNDVRAGLIVINQIKAAQNDDFSGYYLAVNDNLNVNPNTDFNGITGVNAFYNALCPGVSGSWSPVPTEQLNFELSAAFDGTPGSISEIIETGVTPTFAQPTYNDCLSLTLFKLVPSQLTNTIDILNQIQIQQFIGSMNANRMVTAPNGGPPQSLYLVNEVNSESKYLNVMVNPYLSMNNCWNNSQTGQLQKTVRMYNSNTANVFNNFNPGLALQNYANNLYGIGVYNGSCQNALFTQCQRKDVGDIPTKLARMFMEVENPVDYPLDIVVDAGLSTIWTTRQALLDNNDTCIASPTVCYNYDDSYFVDTTELSPYNNTIMTSPLRDAWQTIVNQISDFCYNTRRGAGDVGVFGIVDPLRQIFVNGANFKVINRQLLQIDPTTGQPTQAYATFSRNIYTYLKNLYAGIDNSIIESNANWIYNYDPNTDTYGWYPSSAYKAALYASNPYAWTPALGTNPTGTLSNILDIAINPNQSQRGLLSNIGLNPICRFSNSGYVVWDTKTLQLQQTALSENYIERGMLWLGKRLQAVLQQFIGQPNDAITRTRVKNVIQPILDYMTHNRGLYNSMVICDSRNNTAADIDAYKLNVAVYVQPTKVVKFVLCDIVVTDTSVDLTTINP